MAYAHKESHQRKLSTEMPAMRTRTASAWTKHRNKMMLMQNFNSNQRLRNKYSEYFFPHSFVIWMLFSLISGYLILLWAISLSNFFFGLFVSSNSLLFAVIWNETQVIANYQVENIWNHSDNFIGMFLFANFSHGIVDGCKVWYDKECFYHCVCLCHTKRSHVFSGKFPSAAAKNMAKNRQQWPQQSVQVDWIFRSLANRKSNCLPRK